MSITNKINYFPYLTRRAGFNSNQASKISLSASINTVTKTTTSKYTGSSKIATLEKEGAGVTGLDYSQDKYDPREGTYKITVSGSTATSVFTSNKALSSTTYNNSMKCVDDIYGNISSVSGTFGVKITVPEEMPQKMTVYNHIQYKVENTNVQSLLDKFNNDINDEINNILGTKDICYYYIEAIPTGEGWHIRMLSATDLDLGLEIEDWDTVSIREALGMDGGSSKPLKSRVYETQYIEETPQDLLLKLMDPRTGIIKGCSLKWYDSIKFDTFKDGYFEIYLRSQQDYKA